LLLKRDINYSDMRKILTIILGSLLIFTSGSAQIINGTYAIQNTTTGKNLRPYEAGSHNGNRIVLYDHIEWKCMTWHFLNIEGNTYQLKNLYTSKTFQPAELPAKNGSLLQQQPISKSVMQQWEFIKAEDKSYFIRLKGTELYITASSGKTNSDNILKEKQAGALQLWRLVVQNPDV
jgi:hypothetical protein